MSRQKKQHGCFFYLILFVVIGLFALSFMDGQQTDSATPSEPLLTSSPQLTATPLLTATPHPTATPLPSTPEAWVTAAANEIYGFQLLSVEVSEIDRGQVGEGETGTLVDINCDFKDNFSNDLRRTAFLSDACSLLEKLTALYTEGHLTFDLVSIHGRTTFIDEYGQESEGDAMQLTMSIDDLLKINWENMMGSMLPDIAVCYAVHPAIRD